MRAVVRVLLDELLQGAPAQAQVLDRVRQVAGRGRERQQLADHLELLPGLCVDVGGAELDTPGSPHGPSGRAAEVFLAGGHEAGNIAADAGPDLRLPAARHRQRHPQRQPGAGLVREGHEVHLLCQDRHGARLDFVDGDRCTVHVPDIGGILPVYVADSYEGVRGDHASGAGRRAASIGHRGERGGGADGGAAATSRTSPWRTHLIMEPARARARRLEGGAVRGEDPRQARRVHRAPASRAVLPCAAEGLAGASGVVGAARGEPVGGRGRPRVTERTASARFGVDIRSFRPRPLDEARAGLSAWPTASRAGRRPRGVGTAAPPTPCARSTRARQDRELRGQADRLQGVDLLLAAWPALVVARVSEARLVVVGFGTYRDGLERMLSALAAGDMEELRAVAAVGRELEGRPPELRHLREFLDRQGPVPGGCARRCRPGALHRAGSSTPTCPVLPACQAQVMPSTFPEAFGMVAAEARPAALPLSAAHSGMAEVTAVLAPALEEELRPLLAFEVGSDAVDEIAAKLVKVADPGRRRPQACRGRPGRACRGDSAGRALLRGVVAAALGRLDDLPAPTS